METGPAPTRRTLLSDKTGAEGTAALASASTPVDPLAGALPGWDLVPAVPFLRRR